MCTDLPSCSACIKTARNSFPLCTAGISSPRASPPRGSQCGDGRPGFQLRLVQVHHNIYIGIKGRQRMRRCAADSGFNSILPNCLQRLYLLLFILLTYTNTSDPPRQLRPRPKAVPGSSGTARRRSPLPPSFDKPDRPRAPLPGIGQNPTSTKAAGMEVSSAPGSCRPWQFGCWVPGAGPAPLDGPGQGSACFLVFVIKGLGTRPHRRREVIGMNG